MGPNNVFEQGQRHLLIRIILYHVTHPNSKTVINEVQNITTPSYIIGCVEYFKTFSDTQTYVIANLIYQLNAIDIRRIPHYGWVYIINRMVNLNCHILLMWEFFFSCYLFKSKSLDFFIWYHLKLPSGISRYSHKFRSFKPTMKLILDRDLVTL